MGRELGHFPGRLFRVRSAGATESGARVLAHEIRRGQYQPDLAFPFPNAKTTGATAVNQTIRSIVKPDLWGDRMRVRLSNVFGNQPVTFNATTVALQEYSGNVVSGTVTRVTFRGSRSVTIPAGQEVWSDAINLSWVKDPDDPLLQGRNLAVSYSISGDSGPMTYHSGANTTSFITPAGSGDHTRDVDGFAYEYTTTSWFFLTAVDVMAPTDTVVICVFGDSITDGTHTTLNTNDRWATCFPADCTMPMATKSASSTRPSAATGLFLRP